MHKYKIAFLIFSAASVLMSCRENPVTVQDNGTGFRAKVVDSNNNPISDVNFQYIFFVGANIVSKNYVFTYALQVADTISMVILDPFGMQIARPLNKAPQPAGYHSYNYNASSLPNGVYSCTIIGSTINQRTNFFILTDDIAQLLAANPLTRTDMNGVIELPYSTLGIGDQFLYQNGSAQLELTVSDSIVVLLTKQSYKDYVQGIKLDTTKFTHPTFQLQNN